MNRNLYVFDIETIPLPDAEIREACPEFNPDDVKLGNLGPEKAAAKIEKSRLEHYNRFLEKAALSPLTGRIAAIGILGPNARDIITNFGPEEPAILKWFFDQFRANKDSYWLGYNIANFDVPFLLQRAWHLGIQPPAGLTKGRYLGSRLIDLCEIWRGPAYNRELLSLDRLGRFLGFGGKDRSGAAFAALLYSDQNAAREYLNRDLFLTWEIAKRFGLVERAGETWAPVAEPLSEPEPVEISFW